MIDRAKVVAVIEAEQALIDASYARVVEGCDSPAHCALGALLFAAGVSNDELLNGGEGEPSEWTVGGAFEKPLRDTYGIRRRHAEIIMFANDRFASGPDADTIGRRAEVIRTVIRLADAEAAAPEADATLCDWYDAPEPDIDDDYPY